jgi:hypothetical protein
MVVLNASHVEDNVGMPGCRGGGAAVYGSGHLTLAGASTVAYNRIFGLQITGDRSPSDGGGVYVGGRAELVVERWKQCSVQCC